MSVRPQRPLLGRRQVAVEPIERRGDEGRRRPRGRQSGEGVLRERQHVHGERALLRML